LDGSVSTIIFTEKDQPDKPHVEFVKIDFDSNCIQAILTKIYERNIQSVLVEGGPTILNSFLDAGLWDEANVEVSPQRISEGVAAPVLPIQPISRKNIEGHEWLFYKK